MTIFCVMFNLNVIYSHDGRRRKVENVCFVVMVCCLDTRCMCMKIKISTGIIRGKGYAYQTKSKHHVFLSVLGSVFFFQSHVIDDWPLSLSYLFFDSADMTYKTFVRHDNTWKHLVDMTKRHSVVMTNKTIRLVLHSIPWTFGWYDIQNIQLIWQRHHPVDVTT
jgi:hypothetical protein